MTDVVDQAARATARAASMRGVSRRFGATVALDGVDFDVAEGEIHALLGENGAGKTTLMRILAGLDRPDSGQVEVHGAPVTTFKPAALRAAGVAIVQQHFTLVPTLTAGENLALARPEGWRRPGARAAAARLDELAARYDLPVRSGPPAGQLSVGEQQRLEILRALDADARLLVLDEPTAVLVDREAENLLAVCRRMADEGRSVVIITHRLAEVMAGCDRVSVLRRGAVVLGGGRVSDHDRRSLARLMVGDDTAEGTLRRVAPDGAGPGTGPDERPVRLRLDGVALGRLEAVTLDVRAGEIVGVAGVDGNGQAELESIVAARAQPASGALTLDGEPYTTGGPRDRIAHGVAYIPSDRYRWGLARGLSLAESLELGRGSRWRPHRRHRHRQAEPAIGAWDVRTAGAHARTGSLSGGNAQKLVLARELGAPPRLVLACYPTRGLDPEAARTIASRVVDVAAAGAAVLWFGAELDELFAVADRVVVLAGGRLVGPFLPPYDRGAIGLAMAGGGAS